MDDSLTELGELALTFIWKAMCHKYLRQLWRRRLNGVCESHSVMSDSLQPHGLYSPWNSPGYNTGVGSLSLLQGIFLTQGLNPGLGHCRQILYQLSHQGSPRILEWEAYPFSRGSSWPRNQTRVSHIASRFFTNWAIKEAQKFNKDLYCRTYSLPWSGAEIFLLRS